MRDIDTISTLGVSTGEMREVGEALRNDPKSKITGYYFNYPLSIVYAYNESVPRLYLKDIILEIQRGSKNSGYGKDYVAIGIPQPIYVDVIEKAKASSGVTNIEDPVESNGYVWVTSVSCKRAEFCAMNGKINIVQTRYLEYVSETTKNVVGLAVLEPKLKASIIGLTPYSITSLVLCCNDVYVPFFLFFS